MERIERPNSMTLWIMKSCELPNFSRLGQAKCSSVPQRVAQTTIHAGNCLQHRLIKWGFGLWVYERISRLPVQEFPTGHSCHGSNLGSCGRSHQCGHSWHWSIHVRRKSEQSPSSDEGGIEMLNVWHPTWYWNLAQKGNSTKSISEQQPTLKLNLELRLLLQPQCQHLGWIRPPQLQHQQHEGHRQRQPRQGHVVPEADSCQGQASENAMGLDSQVPKMLKVNEQIIIQLISLRLFKRPFFLFTRQVNCEIEKIRIISIGRRWLVTSGNIWEGFWKWSMGAFRMIKWNSVAVVALIPDMFD